MSKCRYCKLEIEGNPKIVLQRASMLGYDDYDFHDEKCFINYIKKKYRKKLE